MIFTLFLFLMSTAVSPSSKTETATFGTGCFWCTEAIFERIKGVTHVEPGYSGGHVKNPTYDQVSTGRSGHVEVIRIHFDPAIVDYETLLEVFWHVHDPTTLNRQGADIGPQYRSVIFFHDADQEKKAIASRQKTEASKLWKDPIVTEIGPLTNYFTAEAYHHNYYEKNPNAGYCSVVIAPKIRKFKNDFPGLLKQP